MGVDLFGQYGEYVWPSYGLTLLVMGGLLAFSLTRLKRELRALEQAQGGRRRRRSGGTDTADDEEA